MDKSILIISPVKNEAEYLQKTIDCMVRQTHKPALWLIVDDGSDDATGELADKAAAQHSWIRVLHRPKGQPRRVGPGVIEAFYAGISQINIKDFGFVTKLDGDLEFSPTYFEEMMRRFEATPRLGTASGKCWIPVEGKLVYERTGDEFSHGVAKLFRRQCFEEIGGFVREVMWDGIDCHKCRMLGWEAVSYPDESLRIVHLRQMGSSFKSVYHGRVRWGRGQYFMGTHPIYLLGITAYRMLERPWILGGLCIFWGYFWAWLTRKPRYDDLPFRQFLRRWQLRQLFGRLLGRKQQAAGTT